MTDYYTTADLKERGWTDSIIKQHLGKPDGARPNPQGRLRASLRFSYV